MCPTRSRPEGGVGTGDEYGVPVLIDPSNPDHDQS